MAAQRAAAREAARVAPWRFYTPESTMGSIAPCLLLNDILAPCPQVSAMERVLEEKNPLNLLARGADLFAGLVTPVRFPSLP